MLRKLLVSAVAATGALALASSAAASTVHISADHLATGSYITTIGGTIDGKVFGALSVYESPDIFTVSIDGGPSQDLLAFCVDIYHFFEPSHTPPVDYYTASLLNNSDAVLSGGGVALGSVLSGELGYLADLAKTTTDAGRLAGIQGAIWETEYSGLTLSGGSTYVAEYDGLAAAWGASHAGFAGYADALYAADGKTQGFTTGGVPEPASWTLMLMGFGGLGAMLRRRRRAAAATA
jgi:hypothetical protein